MWLLVNAPKAGDPYRVVARYESGRRAWDEALRQTQFGNPGYWAAIPAPSTAPPPPRTPSA